MNRDTRRQAQKEIKKLHAVKTAKLRRLDKELAFTTKYPDIHSTEEDDLKERIKKVGEEIIELERDFDNFDEQGARNVLNKTRHTLRLNDTP